MKFRTVGLALVLVLPVGQIALAESCPAPSNTTSFTHMDRSVSAPSPDARWQFVSAGTGSPDDDAAMEFVDSKTHRRWHVGSLERNGTAIWSDESKWLILIDEYAVDDTKIRLFHMGQSAPREVHGLDRRVRRHVLNNLPRNHSILWLNYPKVCFSSAAPSHILLTVTAPHAPNAGGSGTGMYVDLSIELSTRTVSEIAVRGF